MVLSGSQLSPGDTQKDLHVGRRVDLWHFENLTESKPTVNVFVQGREGHFKQTTFVF